jgi:hypothetical protein
MDPRLSPGLTPRAQNVTPSPAPPAPGNLKHSAAPHPATSAPTPRPLANAVSQPMTPQVVEAFPVKQPEASAPSSLPAMPLPQPSSVAKPGAQPEDELDKILQAVNNKVKAPMSTPVSKKQLFNKKLLPRRGSSKAESPNLKKPIGPVLVVVIVALMLCTTAVLAYRDGNRKATAANQPSKVGTSYTASSSIQDAGGALVNPADLDDYAQNLQTKLNALNDSQDFTSDSLSDQTLGL